MCMSLLCTWCNANDEYMGVATLAPIHQREVLTDWSVLLIGCLGKQGLAYNETVFALLSGRGGTK